MKARTTLCLAISILASCSIDEMQTNAVPEGPLEKQTVFDHSRFDALLREHVSTTGVVDYPGFEKDLPALLAYLDSLAGVDLEALGSDAERMAFWINAYNAITIRGILRFWPTTSIRNHSGFWTNILTVCGGRTVSLDDIEHRILRPLGDPRIHVAVNCASLSCPRLLNEVYTGATLEDQLETTARAFVNDTVRNRFDDRARVAHLSKIFSWFKEDFDVAPYGDARGFVRYFATPRDWLAGDFSISHLDYSWELNGPTH